MGIFKKEIEITTSKDLQTVTSSFENFLKENGWKTQSKVEGNKAIVQAQKAGILRDIVAAERALTFTLEDDNGKLKVNVGVSKWLMDLGVTALEVIFLSELFIFVDVPEMVWNEHVEKELMQQLEAIAQ